MKKVFNNNDAIEAQMNLLSVVDKYQKFSDSSSFEAMQAYDKMEKVTDQFEFMVRWYPQEALKMNEKGYIIPYSWEVEND